MSKKSATGKGARFVATVAAGVAAGGLLAGCATSRPFDRKVNPTDFKDPAKLPAVGDLVHPRQGSAPRPNILVILTDDLGYGDLGCYGATAIKTPNIDGMAAEGARFTDFYCSSPLCSPSRAGLLTGRYPLRSGITFPLQPGKDSFARTATREAAYAMGGLGAIDMKNAKNAVKGLPRSEITIPAALKLSDYATAAIGKWHLGDFVADMKYHPSNYGFDYFCGFNASNDDWPAAFWRDKQELVKDIALDQAGYTRLFTDEAIEFMKRAGDRPFFVYLAHKDPHQPCIPSKDFVDSSNAGRHGDAVQEVDWNVGRILAYLKESGKDRRTLVIFTSDNGPWVDGSPGSFRGRKGESFEGGYRVPFIAYWPGTIPASRSVHAPAMNIDLFPTILGLASLDNPTDRIIDGRDILPLMEGASDESPHDALFFFHYTELEGIRKGDWKYFRNVNTKTWPLPLDKKSTLFGSLAGGNDYRPAGSAASVSTMASWPILYNLEYDPGEDYNVLKRYPEVGAELEAELEAFEASFFKNLRGRR